MGRCAIPQYLEELQPDLESRDEVVPLRVVRIINNKIAEIEANLLEGAQLVPMRILPTRAVDLLRSSQPNMNALRTLIQQNVTLLEPYIDPHPASKHW